MKHLWIGLCVCWALSSVKGVAQSFASVVAADGSGDYTTVQQAVDACQADGKRHFIVIKNGVYQERVNLPAGKVLSLIGESRDGVVITNDRNRGKQSKFRNFRDITTLQCYGEDFYMEGITVANTAGNVGQAEAHFLSGDRQVYRNCKFTGYQDTQRTKNGVRAYLQDCFIEGAVDFIYGGGLIYYEQCALNSVKGGGYITAPEEAAYTESVSLPQRDVMTNDSLSPLRYGYVFHRCALTANDDVPAHTYYLGRPWTKEGASCYLGCTMGRHIKPEGWQTWNGNEQTASFTEHGSRHADGKPVDVSRRVTWSRQLTGDEAGRMTPDYLFARIKVDKPFDYAAMLRPVKMYGKPVLRGKTLSWPSVPEAVGYLIYKNNRLVAAVQETSYTFSDTGGARYLVKPVSPYGVTGDPVGITE